MLPTQAVVAIVRKLLVFVVLCLGCLWIGMSTAYSQQVIDVVEAIQLLHENNDDLDAKRAQFSADQERINQAWSGLKPNVSISASRGYAEYNTNVLEDEHTDYLRMRLSIVQPIFSQTDFKAVVRSEQFVETAEVGFNLDTQVKTLEMLGSYFEVLKFKEAAKLIKQEFEDNALKVKRIDKMLELGLATKMDQLEAQSRHDELRSFRIQSENDVKVSLKHLERFIGYAVDDVKDIDTRLWKRANLILENDFWYDAAEKGSLIVKDAKARYDLAGIDVDMEKAAHWPVLRLKAAASKTDSYSTSIEDEMTVELELTAPLYSGGKVSSKVASAQHVLKSREYEVRDQRKFVKVKLDELLSELSASVVTISALELSVVSNEAYQKAAEKGLDYGLRGVFDVLEAKSRVYRVQRSLSEQIYSNIISQFELLYLVGQLTPETVASYLAPDYDFSSIEH